MELGQKTEWLNPECIQKLYDGQKSRFGMNRLLVIGIGKTGIDCVLHCINITEKRFSTQSAGFKPSVGFKPKKVNFISVGLKEQLEAATYKGSLPADGYVLPIVPGEAIYPYLNDPNQLPEEVLEWFDKGLENYSPAAPVYGLTKRQCGRIALFHMIEPFLKLAGELSAELNESDKPLDIIITGNLGDVFFGGMFIDIAYIMRKIFDDAHYPVRINGYLFAADTAALIETDSRDIGCYSANTIVAKNELDSFQLHHRHFRQKYAEAFEVDSDKPPFDVCFLIPAEDNYALTMNMAAEKILSRMEVLFTRDDDAERLMSYNMLDTVHQHDFRYLSYTVKGAELPVGKIMSCLFVKLFARFSKMLRSHNAGLELLSHYKAFVTPSAEYVASKTGSLPRLEFDEKYDAAFSVKALRGSNEDALAKAEAWVSAMKSAVIEGSYEAAVSIADTVISDCENARTNFTKGPFYAREILKKCLSEIKSAKDRLVADGEDMSEQTRRTRILERKARKKVRISLLAASAAEQYLFELNGYAKAAAAAAVTVPMLDFYSELLRRLNEYYTNVLKKTTDLFEQISVCGQSIMDGMTESQKNDSCIDEIFSLNDAAMSERLDELAESVSEEKLEQSFCESGILSLSDENEFGRTAAEVLKKCFEKELSMDFNEMCDCFGLENIISTVIQGCIGSLEDKTVPDSGQPITRIICPRSVRQEDIAELRKKYHGISYIWNGSVCLHCTLAVSVKSGVRLEDFDGYRQWENMHYAYVNDSLKKHGIHIFSP